MTLWWGLIMVVLVGFVWSTIVSRNSVKSSAFVSDNVFLENAEELESDGSNQTEISSAKSDASSTQHETISVSGLGLLDGIISPRNHCDLVAANANTRTEVGSSRMADDTNHETPDELIREDSTSEGSLIAEDAEDYLSQENTESNLTSLEDTGTSDKFGVDEFENVGKTLRSLITSISEPANLEHKEDDDCVPSRDEDERRTQGDAVLSKLTCFISLERCTYDLVWKTARKLGMRRSNRFWDVMWFDVDAGTKSKDMFIQKCLKMNSFQIISHFPGFWSLSSKDLLVRNLQRMQKRFPGDFDVFPKSWVLPRDGLQLVVYARNHKCVFFIAKPTDSCAGNGIFLTQDVKLDGAKKMVYQTYIRPFLIDGFKFDFRVYVLLTSCKPLRIYVYNEGLARFATVKYQNPTRENCGNVFMHLTNSCVNTRNPSFVKDEFLGHSRRMTGVFKWFQDNRIDSEKIQNAMDDAIIKTMIAVLPTLRHNYKTYFPFDAHSDRCFDIMGFDIMLDRDLNVYVLEANPSPSFGSITHTSFEAELKESVVRDTFKILEGNVMNKLRKRRSPSLSKRGRQESDESIRALVDWENSHLGNFRKVYPPKPSLEKYYQKFIAKDSSLRYNLT